MPDFVYTARNAAGNEVTGTMSASHQREVLDSLHRLNLFPLTVTNAKKGEIRLDFFQPKVKDTLISATLLQLAHLLENGVPVLEAFEVLSQQTTHPVLKRVIDDIHKRIAEGEGVDAAFAAHKKVFNDLTIGIIRAGTEGAFLEDSLRRTGKFLEQQAELRGKVVGALIYPAILLAVGVTAVTVMLLFFVPKFQPLFDQVTAQGKSLPFTTQSLLWMRDFLLKYGLYFIGVLAAAIIWIQGQLSTDWGIRLWDKLKLRLPILGDIMLNGAVL
ncbi:hypothetical protein FACS189419_09100 [Planctomycetales bacterium]|nr:hypothetical protein FACS189419_09100 [Planctomycetales bacterium]